MNEIRRIESEAEEIARVRAIVDRVQLPDFVVSYTVELGFFHDEPSLWVRFRTRLDLPESDDEMLAAGKQLANLVDRVHILLREQYPQRYPYFRFSHSNTTDGRQG